MSYKNDHRNFASTLMLMVFIAISTVVFAQVDCGIVFVSAIPAPGAVGVPRNATVTMVFGPADPACTTFCLDTASFEGVISFGVPGTLPDTIYLSPADVSFAPGDFGRIRITFDAPFDWPNSANVRAFFAVSDCWSHRVHGVTEFSIVADTTVPPACPPAFISVVPPAGATAVSPDHGINMVFGPTDPLCREVCWDTTSFHGWLRIYHDGSVDTVALNFANVDFWFGEAPRIGIEYHHSSPWPAGAEIHGGWAIADCGGHFADGSIRFTVAADTTIPPDCGIVFVSAIPTPGSVGVPRNAPVTMVFGPADPACTTFCLDTSSFEGVISFGVPGTLPDTIYLSPADVSFAPGDFGRIRITFDAPFDLPNSANVRAFFAVSDCWSHRVHRVTEFSIVADTTVPPDTFVVRFITPGDSAQVACTYQQIKFRIEPFVPESLIVYVNWGFYTLGASPELTVSGDTVIFTPTMPWSEGPVVVELLGRRLQFFVDRSNPMMFAVFPSDLSTVPLGPGPTIIARYHIHDSRSGLALESINITVMVDGVLRGTYGIGHPGVAYIVEEVHFDFNAASISLSHGDSVMMIISAADRTWRDFCGPNLRVEDLRFVVGDPAADLHYIRGRIVEAGTGIPVAGVQVQLFDYLAGPISGLTATTGHDGFYSFTVFSGTYSLGAFDSTSHYMPVFFYDRPGLLEADPIFISSTSPDTIFLTTMHMFPSASMLCMITGSVLAEADGPIDAAYVVAISSEDDEIQDAALTGPSGNYELTVPPGEYYVLAFHSSYIPAFYNGTLEWGSATVVNVTADVSGIDLELIPTVGSGDRMIWGFVYSEAESRSAVPLNVRGVRVYVLDVEDDRPVAYGISDFEGRYSIGEIGEGTYKVFGDYCGFNPDVDFVQIELVGWENRLDIEMVPTTGVGEKPALANSFELGSVYPNPFNSSCVIGFRLGDAAEVRIEVLDLTGRVVEVVEDRVLSAGSYISVWSPGNFSSGAYLVRMTANGAESSVKALFIK